MNADKQHRTELLQAMKSRLRILELEAARKGGDCPPHIVLEIEDIRSEIKNLERSIIPENEYDDEIVYRSQMAKMYSQLNFTGIPDLKDQPSVTIKDVFMRLKLISGSGTAVEPVVQQSDLQLNEFAEIVGLDISEQRLSFGEALSKTNLTVILGEPGAGKTTLLKYLIVVCAENQKLEELQFQDDQIQVNEHKTLLPIFIPLSRFAAEVSTRDRNYSLLDYFYTYAYEHLMLNLRSGFFEEALKAERCFVCLDGLDEIWEVDPRRQVCDAITALVGKFQNNRYIITSRIVGYNEAPLDTRSFFHYTILPLTDNDIREFVRRWYILREIDSREREQQVDNLLTTIRNESRIQALARNPLLLTIIALVHRTDSELPSERVKLYDKCVEALIEKWDTAKGLKVDERQRPFYRYRRRLLEQLAYHLHTQRDRPGYAQIIREGNLELLLSRFLMENKGLDLADNPDIAFDEARTFVGYIKKRTGLLMQRGEELFGFPHLTFQEYLAACDIKNRSIHRGAEAFWEAIRDHLHDSHWREVILLLLSSLNSYYELPSLLVEKILSAGATDEFEPVLHRHLFLSACILRDQVDVNANLRRRIVNELLSILRFASSAKREDAITALLWQKTDNYAYVGLLTLANDHHLSGDIRLAAATTLTRLGHAHDVTNTLVTLSNINVSDEIRRVISDQIILHQGNYTGYDILTALANDPNIDKSIRHAAIKVMKTTRQEPAEKLEEIRIRLEAAQEVVILQGTIAEFFRRLLHSDSASAAVERLRELSYKAVLEHNPDNVLNPVYTNYYGDIEDAVQILMAIARDVQENISVRCTAALALGQLGHSQVASRILLAIAADPRTQEKEINIVYNNLKRIVGSPID